MSKPNTQPTTADLTAKLQPIWERHFESGYVGLSGKTVGLRSRHMREFVEASVSSGRPKADAWRAAEECDASARVQAEHAQLMRGLGVAA